VNRRVVPVVVSLLALAAATPATAVTRLPGFHSPSGNIRCVFVPASHLLCTVGHSDYGAALQARCIARHSLDWHGFELSTTGRGLVVCSGGILYNPDTQRPSYVNLPYGATWRHGAFTCRSRVTGVTCSNRRGHGVFVSRERWRTF
jgi:uncharacterized protein DUF6636